MITSHKDSFQSLDQFVHSIRFRLAIWFVVILGIVVVSFSAFVYYRQKRDLESIAAGRLEYKAQRLRGMLRVSGQDIFNQAPSFPMDPSNGAPVLQEGDILAFATSDGVVRQELGPLSVNGATRVVQSALRGQPSDHDISQSLLSATITENGSHNEYVLLMAPVLSEGNLAGYVLLGNAVDPNGQLERLAFSLAMGVALT